MDEYPPGSEDWTESERNAYSYDGIIPGRMFRKGLSVRIRRREEKEEMAELIITVKAGELLGKLKENLVKHKADYDEAVEDYRKKYINRLETALKECLNGKEELNRFPANDLEPPVSYEKDYVRAISMLERVSPDTDIELGEGKYGQLWLDEWPWKERFVASNMSYKG